MARVKHKITRTGNTILFDDRVDILQLAEKHRFCVKSVCTEIGLTPLQFETLLMKFLEIKPKELFSRHRAILARRLIMEGIERNSILSSLGFKHDSHFCLEIKRYYGLPPNKLAKQLFSAQE